MNLVFAKNGQFLEIQPKRLCPGKILPKSRLYQSQNEQMSNNRTSQQCPSNIQFHEKFKYASLSKFNSNFVKTTNTFAKQTNKPNLKKLK